MQKKLKCILLVFCIITSIFICSCNNKDSTSESNIYSPEYTAYTPHNGVVINIPVDFIKKTDRFGGEYYEKNDSVTIAVTIEVVGNKYNNAQEFSDYAVSTYRELYNISDLEESYFNTRSGECKINQFVYNISSGEGYNEKFCYVAYLLKNGIAYIISCTSNPDEAEVNLPDFKFAVESLQVEKYG